MTDEINRLEQAIAALEAQRDTLGAAATETALASLRRLLEERRGPPTERRKLVTVLFSDLVGSTALADGMDPEDTREILHAYFAAWSDTIERYGGVVEKYIGDAVMAVFGLHTARDDDPANAIRVALEMGASLQTLNAGFERDHGVRLEMRIGVHTGSIVVSSLQERPDQDFGVSVALSNRNLPIRIRMARQATSASTVRAQVSNEMRVIDRRSDT